MALVTAGSPKTVGASYDVADPNKLVGITDRLSARTPGTAQFVTLRTASNGEVLREVSFTPTDDGGHAKNSQDR
jgi:hypothetical protein